MRAIEQKGFTQSLDIIGSADCCPQVVSGDSPPSCKRSPIFTGVGAYENAFFGSRIDNTAVIGVDDDVPDDTAGEVDGFGTFDIFKGSSHMDPTGTAVDGFENSSAVSTSIYNVGVGGITGMWVVALVASIAATVAHWWHQLWWQ